eukprot:scaffold166772_cov29-Tisochrysis_lutea.AAC.2
MKGPSWSKFKSASGSPACASATAAASIFAARPCSRRVRLACSSAAASCTFAVGTLVGARYFSMALRAACAVTLVVPDRKTSSLCELVSTSGALA